MRPRKSDLASYSDLPDGGTYGRCLLCVTPCDCRTGKGHQVWAMGRDMAIADMRWHLKWDHRQKVSLSKVAIGLFARTRPRYERKP